LSACKEQQKIKEVGKNKFANTTPSPRGGVSPKNMLTKKKTQVQRSSVSGNTRLQQQQWRTDNNKQSHKQSQSCSNNNNGDQVSIRNLQQEQVKVVEGQSCSNQNQRTSQSDLRESPKTGQRTNSGDQVSANTTNNKQTQQDSGNQISINGNIDHIFEDIDQFDRVLIQWCCGYHSLLGQPKVRNKGCKVIRLTIDDDLRTPQGLNKALKIIEMRPEGRTRLWSAMPCAGGSHWQALNINQGIGLEQIEGHWKDVKALWDNFIIAATAVMKIDGVVDIEWPDRCKYWWEVRVVNFLRKHKLTKITFHGCAYGLKTTYNIPIGQPLKKPWRCSSNNIEMLTYLNEQCPGDHLHAVCRRKDCKVSEDYTEEVAEVKPPQPIVW
jgi:hypothetical protein